MFLKEKLFSVRIMLDRNRLFALIANKGVEDLFAARLTVLPIFYNFSAIKWCCSKTIVIEEKFYCAWYGSFFGS